MYVYETIAKIQFYFKNTVFMIAVVFLYKMFFVGF